MVDIEQHVFGHLNGTPMRERSE